VGVHTDQHSWTVLSKLFVLMSFWNLVTVAHAKPHLNSVALLSSRKCVGLSFIPGKLGLCLLVAASTWCEPTTLIIHTIPKYHCTQKPGMKKWRARCLQSHLGLHGIPFQDVAQITPSLHKVLHRVAQYHYFLIIAVEIAARN